MTTADLTINSIHAAADTRDVRVGRYVVRLARTDDEFEQIHKLNYRTFVEEIPQHEARGGVLVDKFHEKNTYFIVKEGDAVVGMIAVHDKPPFSIADKMEDPDALLRLCPRPAEVRLLAIEPRLRNRPVFAVMTLMALRAAQAAGASHLVISGFDDRLLMYQRLGFEPIGPAVASGKAKFVPMAISLDPLPPRLARNVHRWDRHLNAGDAAIEPPTRLNDLLDQPVDVSTADASGSSPSSTTAPAPTHTAPPTSPRRRQPVLLLPGPVHMSPRVAAASHEPPIYHRGERFQSIYRDLRSRLSNLVGGADVALFCGSGTLANDVVAATLAADPQVHRGIILVNGEFGQRLTRQAKRFGLEFSIVESRWAQPWRLDAVRELIEKSPKPYDFVWAVHLETSTGMLNDIESLRLLLQPHNIRLCLDCVSSLGAAQVDMSRPGMHLATASSGKSLGAKAGVAIVLAQPDACRHVRSDHLPTYLDLPAAIDAQTTRFTFSSQDIVTLAVALEAYDDPAAAQRRRTHYAATADHIRRRLTEIGLQPMVQGPHAAPIITTFAPPSGVAADQMIERCRRWGFLIGGESAYLQQRNLVQIANMGAIDTQDADPLFDRLRDWLADSKND